LQKRRKNDILQKGDKNAGNHRKNDKGSGRKDKGRGVYQKTQKPRERFYTET
jgi:hypothetical protein